MREEHPPQPVIIGPQNLARLLDRHLPHQGQRKGLKLLREAPAAPLPRSPHGEDLPAIPALAARQRADDLRLQLADVQVPPAPLRGVVVARDARAGAMGTTLFGPQARRLLHPDQHALLLFHIIDSAHPPPFAQRQNLMKDLFWNHDGRHCTSLHTCYQLQTPRNHKRLKTVRWLAVISNQWSVRR